MLIIKNKVLDMKERLFIKKMKEQVFMKEFIREYFADSRCGEIEIQYTPIGTRIIVYTTSPGLVIGAGGERIRALSEKLTKDHGIENPQIDVQKIQEPDLDPHIVANSIAGGLENRVNFKRLGKYYLERIMNAGAIGVEIIIKGKLSGEKARKERFVAGYIKKSGEPKEKDVVFGRSIARPSLGAVAVNVSIMIRHSDKKIVIKREEPVEKEVPPVE